MPQGLLHGKSWPNIGSCSEEVTDMATTTTDERQEVVGTTSEAVRDQALRLKKRRDLKTHAFVYVLVNAVVWGIWTVIG